MNARSAATLLLISATTVVAAAGLSWFALRPDVPFLPRRAPARWIMYPRPAWYWSHAEVALETEYERQFELDEVPRRATLSVSAFRTCEILLNGRKVLSTTEEPQSWKQRRDVNVVAALKPGENELRVTVTNDYGPPALWLTLNIDGKPLVVTDESWNASYAGATVLPARLAADARLRERLFGLPPRPAESLRARSGTVLVFAVAAAVLWIAFELWQRSLERRQGSADRGLSRGAAAVAFAVVAACWITLGLHNQRWLTMEMGSDSHAHLTYIDHLVENRSLPPHELTIQAHQPPLYYLVGALLIGPWDISAVSTTGLYVLRTFSLVLGILHIGFIFLSLRLLFPRHAARQFAGLVIAGFLPVHLFIFQYVSNETLMAALGSASLYVALRIIATDRASWKAFATLGVLLGAALSTKLTAVIVVAAVIGVLGGWLLTNRAVPLPNAIGKLALAVFLFTVLGSFHYVRMWHKHGSPLLRQIDRQTANRSWIQPELHTIEHFLRFGGVFEQPFFAGQHAVPDALYSTFWGDGRRGGRGHSRICPPWNYDLMSANYLIAMVPTVAILAGAALALVHVVREPRSTWLLLLGVAFLMITAIVYENLHHPRFTVAKAWYALPVVTALCAFGAWGFDPWQRRHTWWRGIGFVPLGCWALCAYASFWIHAGTADTYARVGAAHFARGRHDEAAQELEAALKLDPKHARANFWYGELLVVLGRVDVTPPIFARAATHNPDDSRARALVALAIANGGEYERALKQLNEAVRRTPDSLAVRRAMAIVLENSGDFDAALAAVREGLRIRPDDATLHSAAARLYDRLGDHEQAVKHRDIALRVNPLEAEAHRQLAEKAIAEGRAADAMEHYRRALEGRENMADVAAILAWLLSTHPDANLRNGAEALALIQRVVGEAPGPAHRRRTLAAAYAENGEFDKAIREGQIAMDEARSQSAYDLEARIRQDVRAYRAGRAVRQPPALYMVKQVVPLSVMHAGEE